MHILTEFIYNHMKPMPNAEKYIVEDNEEIGFVSRYTLREILQYVDCVEEGEIIFIRDAFSMNMALLEMGLQSLENSLGLKLKEENGGKLLSKDECKTAQLFCCGALEGHAYDENMSTMTFGGNALVGIMLTLPLLSYQQIHGDKIVGAQVLRATALACLIAACVKGCLVEKHTVSNSMIVSGIGLACGLCYLQGGTESALLKVISDMSMKFEKNIYEITRQDNIEREMRVVESVFQIVDHVMR